MPELKRLFVRGRMNKDLDERLLPSGEYRDALNIQVGSSEGSDVGAIQNILGNQVKRKKPTKQLWEEDDATHNYYGLPLNAVCIGAIKDDITDSIYYFVTSSEVDCIIKYDGIRDSVSPVLVDAQNILKFSTTKLITGVNLIDNYLFFTDNNSEPKKVHVAKFGGIMSDFVTHSQYKGRDFIESDITVIKKSPLGAPKMVLSNSKRGGNVITTLNYNFSQPQNNDGSLDDSILTTDISATYETLQFNTSVDYLEGDILLITAPALGTDADYATYTVVVEVESVEAADTITAYITRISPVVPDDNDFLWAVDLQQDEAPFEKKMPRFGYRWKYDDNQYSAFSPFTEVAFMPTEFNYNSTEGHNKGMANSVRLIKLFDPNGYSNFQTEVIDKIPVDVKKIEILYKETNNATIYIVNDFVKEKFEEASWEGFKIDTNLIYKIVQSNQLLRPWDNVPRKALAQEISGNRIIYGNYLQNYNINTQIDLAASTAIGGQRGEIARGLPSIKSDRNYQVGVVFKDEYGRETPVFISEKSGIQLNKKKAKFQNKIKARGYGAAPQGFTHYKFFVKDAAGQYYNLAADSAYVSKDNITIWISFPSSERNKVQEGDFITLKKGHDSSTPVEAADAKYKILNISNEAPSELREKRSLEYETTIGFGDTFGSDSLATTYTVNATPSVGGSTFLIAKEYVDGPPSPITDGATNELRKALKKGSYIKFKNSNGSSAFYKVADVYYEDEAASPGKECPKVKIAEQFTSDIQFLYDPGTPTAILNPDNNQLEVYGTEIDDNDADFDGVFFVKIAKNYTLTDNFFPGGEYQNIQSAFCPPFDNLNAVNASTQQIPTDTDYDMPYDPPNKIFLSVWGGGISPRRLYDEPHYNGGLGKAISNLPFWDNYFTNQVYAYASNISSGGLEWDLVLEMYLKASTNPNDPDILDDGVGVPLDFFEKVSQIGTRIKFSNHPTVYTVRLVHEFFEQFDPSAFPGAGPDPSNIDLAKRVYLKFDKDLEQTVNPNFIGSNLEISILGLQIEVSFKTSNPAIFETEPKELADINLFYEASNAFPISEYNDSKVLTWHNCFTFGNGVESNRINDDFNAPFIDKGTKASTVLEEPYEEERRATGLIYSGIFNSNSGLNDLNQFIQAEKITKDLNPIYGSIQKLHARDTNLVTLCEDKCLRILANKDALFNADGNSNVTSNNNVLGQAVPFAGEFGISKNPESFASYGYRAYFTDKSRGVVLRLSMDGLTEISSKGMVDYFWENLKGATTVLGSYDIYSDAYTLTLNNNTVCFKESTDGWPTRKSFIPEFGISLNSDYYTMSNGMLWAHNNQLRNTFYEGATAKSSVRLIFNDIPNKIKNFKTLSYEGDSGWISPLIQTDQQDGAVTTFLDKENIYYNYIRGLNDTWDNNGQVGTLDLKQFAAQGIGQPASFDSYTGHTTFIVTVKNDPNN